MSSSITQNLKNWSALKLSPDEKAEVERLVALAGQTDISNEDRLKLEAFDSPLAFGTGGLRGKRGQGSGCMNRFTVSRAAEAFCRVLKDRLESIDPDRSKIKRTVVIGGDSRIQTSEFIIMTAYQAVQAGFKAVIFPEVVPTPLLSFAIRHLGAAGGVVITASHNPREYNGFKAYLEDGGQIVSPVDKETQALIDNFNRLNETSLPIISAENGSYPVKAAALPFEVEVADPSIFDAYCEELKSTLFARKLDTLSAEQKSLPLVYSPLHGTGGWYMPELLKRFGFTSLDLVAEQTEPDGNFPTVVYPNPEEAEALTLSQKLALKNGAVMFMATDPDSDRLGVGVRTEDGQYELLNGNQIGSIMASYMINLAAGQPKRYRLFKTIVTSDLQRDIADHHNLPITDVLTGFKYIADEMNRLDAVQTGEREYYLFGGEESYGYLPVDFVHDKDSLSSCLLLCTIAADKGDLLSYLDEIYCTYGLYMEGLKSITLEGSEGRQQIEGILEKLKSTPPEGQFDRAFKAHVNLETGQVSGDPGATRKEELLGLPSSKVIQLFLDDAKITVRPSGTEPKIKFYFSFKSKQKPSDRSEVTGLKEALLKEIDVHTGQLFDWLGLKQ